MSWRWLSLLLFRIRLNFYFKRQERMKWKGSVPKKKIKTHTSLLLVYPILFVWIVVFPLPSFPRRLSVAEQALLVRPLDFPLQNMIQAKCLVPRNSLTVRILFVALDISNAIWMLPRTQFLPYRARTKFGYTDRSNMGTLIAIVRRLIEAHENYA